MNAIKKCHSCTLPLVDILLLREHSNRIWLESTCIVWLAFHFDAYLKYTCEHARTRTHVSMHVHVHMWACTYTYTCEHARTRTHVSMCMYTYTCEHVHVHVHMWACARTRTHVSMSMCTYTYTCEHAYTYMYTCEHVPTSVAFLVVWNTWFWQFFYNSIF